MEDLPIFNVSIDPELREGENELGWTETAYTADPAIIIKGMAYKNQREDAKLHFADEKKYRVTAPAMIPMDIYRADEDGEYEVSFTPEVIEQIFVKFMSNIDNKKSLFNLEHNEKEKVPAYLLEAWLVDNPKEDKAYSTFGIEVPKGTLMLTTQVTDKDYYNSLVENDQLGYSIEAFLALRPKEQFNNHKMELPNGKFTLDGKEYEVVDGNITEVQLSEVEESEEVATEQVLEETVEPKEETVMEDVEEKEEAMAEETAEVTEEVTEEEMAVDPELDAEAVLSIVKPFMDEIIAEIASIKEEMAETAEVAPVEDAEVEMSAQEQGKERFSKTVNFLKS